MEYLFNLRKGFLLLNNTRGPRLPARCELVSDLGSTFKDCQLSMREKVIAISVLFAIWPSINAKGSPIDLGVSRSF